MIKYDEQTNQVVRDKNGLCQLSGPGEVGMLVSNIDNRDPIKAFDGYTNVEETNKKILTNALYKGDCIFLSGDLLYMDDLGFLYFRDRTGDTFRWKGKFFGFSFAFICLQWFSIYAIFILTGENVSTTEVETLISSLTHLSECVCFGVEVPGNEGRACMLAIVEHPKHKLNLKDLLVKLKEQLPSYSIPIFIRMVHNLEYTATYKLQKQSLKKQAYNVKEVKDPIYMLNEKRTDYVLINQTLYEDILTSNVRF